MREFIDSPMWQRRGTSIVFDKTMLGPLLASGVLISLREALAWLHAWPVSSPVPGRSVLVAGLDTVLDVLSKDDAEHFVRDRVRRLIAEFQDRWADHALVFGLNVPAQRLREDPVTEHVYFQTGGGARIGLSTDLWNGSAVTDLGRLIRTEDGRQIVGGYYAPRS